VKRASLLKGAALHLVVALAACSPALNWRQTELEGMTTMLPCKPDRAARPMPLGTEKLEMQMAGCEAEGALYAIGHVKSYSVDSAAATLRAWRTATLANMQANNTNPQPWKAKGLTTVAKPLESVELVSTEGKRADGTPIQARLAWVQRGADVYQIAVYAGQLEESMIDPLLSEVQWP
jgi:hypothetical protein